MEGCRGALLAWKLERGNIIGDAVTKMLEFFSFLLSHFGSAINFIPAAGSATIMHPMQMPVTWLARRY